MMSPDSKQVLLGDQPALRQIAEHHAVIEDAVCLYYSSENPSFSKRFASDTGDEVCTSHNMRLRDASAMTLLAAIEASCRVDDLQRNYGKKRDNPSRTFHPLYKKRHQRVSLLDDLLQAGFHHSDAIAALVGDIRAAFKYRNWLAHGRYWVPKPGRQ